MEFDETWHRNDIQYFGPNTRSICISGPMRLSNNNYDNKSAFRIKC